MKELCAVAQSVIERESSTEKPTNFTAAIDFLQAFVKMHGDRIEKDAMAVVDGRSTQANAERGREIGKCLEDLMLTTIAAINTMLGSVWNSPQRQGNGQPAFETKAEPVDRGKQTSSRGLSSVLSLLKTCAERCPVFLIHLPSAPGLDRNEDLLLRYAVDSAVSSILDRDAETSKSAIQFLDVVVILTQSSSHGIRQIVEEIWAPVRWSVVSAIVVGSCGQLNASNLDDAAILLKRTLSTLSSSPDDMHASLAQALTNEHFHLGTKGRTTAISFLAQSCRGDSDGGKLGEFLQGIWELHQIESPVPFEQSDSVARFCKIFST